MSQRAVSILRALASFTISLSMVLMAVSGVAPAAQFDDIAVRMPRHFQLEGYRAESRVVGKTGFDSHNVLAQATTYPPATNYAPAPNYASPPSYAPAPNQNQPPQRHVARGAARGAALGAVGGAITGDAGKGAAAGAAMGGLAGGFRRRDARRRQQGTTQPY